MHLENLFQFIVPLTFLAIWALTSLFNREAQPLPQRMARPQPPGGPGPGGGTLRSEALNRDPSLRWTSPTVSDRPVARRPNEEILIIEETRRPSSTAPMNAPATRSSAGGGTRRGSRPRPAAAAPKRTETPTPRALSGSLTPVAGMAPMSRTLDLNPLNLPASPLMASHQRDLAHTVSEPTRQATRPALVWDDYKLLVSTPSKLREAILVSEILQPPLSLRRRRPGT